LSETGADGVPHGHLAARFVGDSFPGMAAPEGVVNLGLAHGVPGPLALLSLARIQGIDVAGQAEAIRRTADLLCSTQVADEWGPNFPAAVAAGGRGKAPASRAAWCYGTPGVARSLWLSADATGCERYREVAVEAMEAVFRRPVDVRRIDSPTLCHGVAGLLQVTLRLARASGLAVFHAAAATLLAQLLAEFEPASLVGFPNREPSGNRVEQPGFLDGAAGVALVLLAASSPIEPVWDCALLLS
jgi:hypothetical protein